MPEPRTITLSQRAWIAVVAVVLLGLGVFVAQLVFIVQQRALIDNQLHVARRQEDRARPVLGTVNALLGSRGDTLAAARRAGDALTDLQRVLRAALDQDLVGVTTEQLRRVPELLAMVDRTVAILGRTYPTLRESLDVQHRSLGVQEGSLSIQRRSLDIQRRTLSAVVEALGVARATLSHAESIDRKTGGPVPPVVP